MFELAEYGDIKSKLEQELKELAEVEVSDDVQNQLAEVEVSDDVQKQLAEVEVSDDVQKQEKQDKLMDKISNVLEAMNSTDNSNEKRKYLQQIIKEIRISPNNIEFIYNI